MEQGPYRVSDGQGPAHTGTVPRGADAPGQGRNGACLV